MAWTRLRGEKGIDSLNWRKRDVGPGNRRWVELEGRLS